MPMNYVTEIARHSLCKVQWSVRRCHLFNGCKRKWKVCGELKVLWGVAMFSHAQSTCNDYWGFCTQYYRSIIGTKNSVLHLRDPFFPSGMITITKYVYMRTQICIFSLKKACIYSIYKVLKCPSIVSQYFSVCSLNTVGFCDLLISAEKRRGFPTSIGLLFDFNCKLCTF